jgi:hypothetical protein
MLKMLSLHFGPTVDGLTDALKNVRSVADRRTAILNALQQFSAVPTAEAYTEFLRRL